MRSDYNPARSRACFCMTQHAMIRPILRRFQLLQFEPVSLLTTGGRSQALARTGMGPVLRIRQSPLRNESQSTTSSEQRESKPTSAAPAYDLI